MMLNAKSLLLTAVTLYGIAVAAGVDIVNASNPNIQQICTILPLGKTVQVPNSCTHWARCPTTSGGDDYDEGACVAGLYYNKDTETCEPLSRVSCPYSSNASGVLQNRCAAQKDGSFIADETDCSYYIYCSEGKEARSACPGNLVFNPERGACVYRNEYNCPKPKEQRQPDPICRSVPEGLKFANEHECVKYHVCAQGALTTLECDYGLAFDHLSGLCVPTKNVSCLAGARMPEPENTICGTKEQPRVGYYADDKACNAYYICGEVQADGTPDRKPYHLHCDSGYFFDAQRLSCRDRLNVKCTLDRCVGMGNKYVNIAGNCSAYAHCKDGVTVRTGTCPTNYYFDERSQGCTTHNINYAACAA